MSGFRRAWRMRVAGVGPEAAFAVIDDIESYPHFLPAMREARVMGNDGAAREVVNRFVIGPFELHFRSRALRPAPLSLSVQSQDGPWRRLKLDWRVEPAADGCLAFGEAALDFRSPMIAFAAELGWPAIETEVKTAFLRRMRKA